MKYLSNLRRAVDKYKLEKLVSRNLELMAGHQQVGLPPGHQYFKTLWQDTKVAIWDYSQKYHLPYESVIMGVPRLRELQSLANSETSKTPTTVYLIGVLISGVAFTIYLALCRDVYIYFTHLRWIRYL